MANNIFTFSNRNFSLKHVAQRYPDTVRMILSGYGERDEVTEAIKQGYTHAYFHKPWDTELLLSALGSAL